MGTVVLGGSLVTTRATTHSEELMLASGADIAVIGEGEQTIVELVAVTGCSGNLGDVKGIVYREGEKVVFCQLRDLEPHQDNVPCPVKHLLDMEPATVLGRVEDTGVPS